MGLRHDYAAANPDDTKVGQLDFKGTGIDAANGQPVAVFRSYYIDNEGNVQPQNIMMGHKGIEHMSDLIREEHNHNQVHNLEQLKQGYQTPTRDIKSGKDFTEITNVDKFDGLEDIIKPIQEKVALSHFMALGQN